MPRNPILMQMSKHSTFLHGFCANIFLTYLQSTGFSEHSTQKRLHSHLHLAIHTLLYIFTRTFATEVLPTLGNMFTNVQTKCLCHFINCCSLPVPCRCQQLWSLHLLTGEANGSRNHLFYQVVCCSAFSPTLNSPRTSTDDLT